MVDVEMLDTVTGDPMILQVGVRADEYGVTCKFAQTGGNDCTGGGVVDYSTNTITLYTNDGDLVLTFSDSVNATATLGSNTGNAKVVTQEMFAKTRVRPNGVQSTQLYLTNPVPGYGTAALIDVASSGATLNQTLWDNSVMGSGYFDTVLQFFASDWDGIPAINGTAAAYETDTATTSLLADGQYKLTMLQHVDGLADRSFKVNYAFADPTSLVPPLPNAVTVNGTSAAGTNAGSPLALGGAEITDLSWVSTSPVDAEWQIIIRGVDGSNVDIPGQDIRTSWMSTSHAGLSLDTGTNTWTWSNPDVVPADAWGNGKARIILRVRPAGDGDIQGIGPTIYVTP
jgi:hypothetical protein